MSKTKVVWDYAAAGDLMLRSQAIADFCDAEAEKRTHATGMDYVSNIRVGSQRVRAGAYDAVSSDSTESVCPKCGEAHPNYRCNKK